MISYKVLIILTVIFYIITYCNGAPEEDILNSINESEAEILKSINESKDYKVCDHILNAFLFHYDSGYFNLLYVLKFIYPRNDEIFLEHVRSKFSTPSEEIDQTYIYTEQNFMNNYDIKNLIANNHNLNDLKIISSQDIASTTSGKPDDATSIKDQTKMEITSFIYSFYKDASEVDFKDFETWNSLFTCCAINLKKGKEANQESFDIFGFIKKPFASKNKTDESTKINIKKIFDADDGIEEKELLKRIINFRNEEGNKQDIEDCKKSILKFKTKINGKEFKCDENNIFKCALIFMELNISQLPDVKKAIGKMDKHQLNYLNYIKSLSEYKNTEYHMFTTSSLCQMYVYKKKLKEQKDSVRKED